MVRKYLSISIVVCIFCVVVLMMEVEEVVRRVGAVCLGCLRSSLEATTTIVIGFSACTGVWQQCPMMQIWVHYRSSYSGLFLSTLCVGRLAGQS